MKPPSDKEIVAYVSEHYSKEMAAQVQAAIRSKDLFGHHVRRSFVREMTEPKPFYENGQFYSGQTKG